MITPEQEVIDGITKLVNKLDDKIDKNKTNSYKQKQLIETGKEILRLVDEEISSNKQPTVTEQTLYIQVLAIVLPYRSKWV